MFFRDVTNEDRGMKKIKTIIIDADKCTGCRICETMCSAFHAEPKYSIVNPKRSRIRVLFDPVKNIFVPVLAGSYTKAECNCRYVYTIDGIEYDECSFCRASCPSRDLFTEPDAPDTPLKCDMCEEEPPLEEPVCVKWCHPDALIYEEREEEEEEEEEKPDEMEIGLESLVKKYGAKEVMDTVNRLAKE